MSIPRIEHDGAYLGSAGESPSFHFAVIGDTHTHRTDDPAEQSETAQRIVEELNLLGPDFVLHAGDLIRGYTDDESRLRAEHEGAKGLFERLEEKLEQYPSQLTRACVELAKDWRTDRYLRRLEAMLAVADESVSLILSGTGDVLEPEDGLIGIGSGGNFALAAARALIDRDDLDAEAVARRAMEVAAGICIYTNDQIVLESL